MTCSFVVTVLALVGSTKKRFGHYAILKILSLRSPRCSSISVKSTTNKLMEEARPLLLKEANIHINLIRFDRNFDHLHINLVTFVPESSSTVALFDKFLLNPCASEKLTRNILSDCFGARFVPHFRKKPNFQNGQKAWKIEQKWI